jgi:hypothetical protein
LFPAASETAGMKLEPIDGGESAQLKSGDLTAKVVKAVATTAADKRIVRIDKLSCLHETIVPQERFVNLPTDESLALSSGSGDHVEEVSLVILKRKKSRTEL